MKLKITPMNRKVPLALIAQMRYHKEYGPEVYQSENVLFNKRLYPAIELTKLLSCIKKWSGYLGSRVQKGI